MKRSFGFKAYDVDNNSEPFVFISYKSEEYERIAPFAKFLHDRGINIWYDEGLVGGEEFADRIMKVIAKPHCKAVLFFITTSVIDSAFIDLETSRARNCKKPIIGIYLDYGIDLEKMMGPAEATYITKRQTIDAYFGARENVCNELLSATLLAMRNRKPIPRLKLNAGTVVVILAIAILLLVIALTIVAFAKGSKNPFYILDEKMNQLTESDPDGVDNYLYDSQTDETYPTTQTADVPWGSNPNVGDIFTFGEYQNDMLRWRVLDVDDDRMLVLSESIVDTVTYDKENTAVTWATCKLRGWLNDDFYNSAFSSDEKNYIESTKVAVPSDRYETSFDGSTTDKIFCLSAGEVERYLPSESSRKAYATDYAKSKGVFVCDGTIEGESAPECKGCSAWWLRTPGMNNYRVSVVYFRGEIYSPGEYTHNYLVGVRPAMYISLA